MASEIKFAKEFIRKHYSGPLLSRQKQNHSRQEQITHGKSKSLTAKANSLRAKVILPSGVHLFGLVLFIFIGTFTVCRIISGFGQLTFSITSTEKACKHDIYQQFRNEITDSILFSGGQSVLLSSKCCNSSQKGIGYTTLHSLSFSTLNQCFP